MKKIDWEKVIPTTSMIFALILLCSFVISSLGVHSEWETSVTNEEIERQETLIEEFKKLEKWYDKDKPLLLLQDGTVEVIVQTQAGEVFSLPTVRTYDAYRRSFQNPGPGLDLVDDIVHVEDPRYSELAVKFLGQ